MNVPRLALLSSLVAATPLLALGQQASQANHDHAAQAKLVQIVREATRQFLDVNNAGPEYAPAFGCVSGPDHGAMGIHYINGALVVDGEVDAAHPEALIYEPVGD
jgi:galactokinase